MAIRAEVRRHDAIVAKRDRKIAAALTALDRVTALLDEANELDRSLGLYAPAAYGMDLAIATDQIAAGRKRLPRKDVTR